MTLNTIQTDKAPTAIGPYSQGIAASPFIFVSGQLGLDPVSGELVSPDFEDQARQALENMKQIVTAAGADLTQVTAVDVFVTDMGKFADFNKIYATFFTDHKPARAVVEVSSLPKGGKVELKCVVYTG